MAAQGPNPIVYIFPAILLFVAIAYFAYGGIDRSGLETLTADVRVTGKQIATGSKTYTTNVVGGRTYTQSQQNPDAYIVEFELDGIPTGGAVSTDLYNSLSEGDLVHVEYSRTRLSHRILVTKVSR